MSHGPTRQEIGAMTDQDLADLEETYWPDCDKDPTSAPCPYVLPDPGYHPIDQITGAEEEGEDA